MLRRVLLLIGASVAMCGCKPQQPVPAPVAESAAPAVQELIVNDVAVGSGEPIVAGQTAVVHYTGWLYQPGLANHRGTQFDSSRDKGRPFRFVVGAGRVIKGWDQGVAGMAVGGRRELIVPAHLAYGDSGAGGIIPPGATLVFDVELLAIEPGR